MYLLFFTSFLSASFDAFWIYWRRQWILKHWAQCLRWFTQWHSAFFIFFLFLGNSKHLTQPFWTAVEVGLLCSSKVFFYENDSSGSYFCTGAGRSEPIILIHKGWAYFSAAFLPSPCHVLSIFINLQWITSSFFLFSGSGNFSEARWSSFVLTLLNDFL